MRRSAVLGDLKSLLILFGVIVFAILFLASLAATVVMISNTLSGTYLEVAPVLALVFGILTVAFGGLFVGLLYHQVRFLRGKGSEPR